MNRLIRFLKNFLRSIAYCVAFVLVAAIVAFLFLGFTTPGARVVATLIEKYASTPDQIVQINDPSALLTGNFTAGTIALFDSKGAYAEIRELSIDWTPTALFSRRFDAAKLSAGYIRIERLPIPSAETQEVRSAFALPLDVKIDAFDLKDLVIGEQIAGTDQHLSLQGKVDATNQSVSAQFAMAQRDRPDAKAVADIVFNPASDELKLETTVDDGKGGLLAKLLRLPGEPAVHVVITGDGPLSKWNGSLSAALDGTEVLNLTGRHTLGADGFRTLAVTGGGTFSDLLPANLKPLFAGTTDIDLSAGIEGGKTIRIEKGTLSSDALNISASGTYSTTGQNDLQVGLSGKNGPIDFRTPLKAGEAHLAINTANVSIIGDAQSAILDIAADIGLAEAPQGSVEVIKLHAYSDDFNLATQSGPMKTAIETGATRFADANLDRLVKGPAKIDGTLTLSPQTIAFDPLAIESASVGGTLSGAYSRNDGTVRSDFKLFALPATLPPALAAKFATTIGITGAVATGADGTIQLTDLALRSGTLNAVGSATLETGNITAAITGDLPDLGKLLADAAGAATFKADLSGPVETLAIKAEVTSNGATLAGRTLDDLVIKADANLNKGAPEAAITSTGKIDAQTIDAKVDLASKDGVVSIPTLEAQIGRNTLKGALDLTADFQPNGSIDFAFPDVGLLAAMAGQTATGDIAGSAAISSRDGVTSVIVKADGSGLRRGDLSIVKPRVDLTIADLKSLAVKGNVTVEALTQGSTTVSGLSLAFDQQDARTRFTLDGTYDGGPLAMRGDMASASGRTDITLQSFNATPKKIPLSLASPSTIVIENGAVNLHDLAIDAAGGRITLNGSAGETLNLTGKIAALDVTLPLAQGEAKVSLTSADLALLGTLKAARIDLNADVASAGLPQGNVKDVKLKAHSDTFDLTTQTGAVTATVETGATQLVNADLDRLIKGPLKIETQLDVASGVVTFKPATIESTNLEGTVTGSAKLADASVTADVALSLRPAGLPSAAAARFDAPIGISGSIVTGAGGAVDVRKLKIDSTTVQAAGTVTLKDANLTAALTGTLPDLGKVLSDAKGKAAFKADVTGPLERLGIKAQVTSSGATLAGRTLSDLVLTADAIADQKSPQATITATGALDGQAINIKTDLVSKDGRTSLPVLNVQVGDNTMTGAVEFTTDFLPQGSIAFDFPDVGLLAAMAGEKASGDLAGSATIDSTGGKTAITLKASGSGIRRGDLIIAEPKADIVIADLKTLAVKGSLSVEKITQGTNQLNGLKLDFQQNAGKTDVVLDGRYDGAPLTLRADIQSASGKTTVNLASFAASPRKIAVKLAAPTVVTIQNGIVNLQKLTIAASGGTIAVSGSVGPSLDVSAKLDAVPARLINTFVPSLGADGAISGTVAAKGTPAAPVVSYDLRWANAAFAQARSAGVGTLDIAAKGNFADDTVTLDTTISGGGGLAFRGGGKVGITGNKPIALKLNGNLPFSLLSGLLAQQGFTLTGQAAVDVTIAGNATAPQITGTITTSNGRFVDVRRNVAITNLTANIALDGRQARISKLTGKLASGGSVNASGTIGIAPDAGFPADLTIGLDNATYVDGSLFTANVDGNLTLKGPLTGNAVLGGKVTINRSAITIPEKLPASLAQINIKHKNAPSDVKRMQADVRRDQSKGKGEGKSSGGISFDLTVSAPGKMFARGRGIDAELGGDLTIRGTAAQPSISGAFDLRRGRIQILGKRLDFSDGTITFGGGLIPVLDLDATSTAGSTTITVNVAGVANNPTVTFTSSPALPQDEILAQLIFNRSLSNLSALQIAQLASAVSQLAGGGSNSLLDGLRNKLGVDDLDVSTDASGGAQVTAGKYINDRTYLELKSGGDAGGGKAVINLDVGRGVKLRGEAGSSGGGAGIFYEKEY